MGMYDQSVKLSTLLNHIDPLCPSIPLHFGQTKKSKIRTKALSPNGILFSRLNTVWSSSITIT